MDGQGQRNGNTKKRVFPRYIGFILFLIGFCCGVYLGPLIAYDSDWIPNPTKNDLMYSQMRTGDLIKENQALKEELARLKPAPKTLEE